MSCNTDVASDQILFSLECPLTTQSRHKLGFVKVLIIVKILSEKIPNKAFWLLYVAMIISLPTLFFLYVVAGFIPTGVYFLTLFIHGPIYLLFGMIYAIILFYLAKYISTKLETIGKNLRLLAYTLLILIILSIGLVPMYGTGHNSIDATTAYEQYRSVWKKLYWRLSR